MKSGYDPAYGARPLKRAIQKEIETPLARKLVAGEIRDGQKVRVDRRTGIERDGVRSRIASACRRIISNEGERSWQNDRKFDSDAAVVAAEELGAVSRADDAAVGGTKGSVAAVEAALATEDKEMVVVAQRDASVRCAARRRLYTVGTRAAIRKVDRADRTNWTSWCWAWSAW